MRLAGKGGSCSVASCFRVGTAVVVHSLSGGGAVEITTGAAIGGSGRTAGIGPTAPIGYTTTINDSIFMNSQMQQLISERTCEAQEKIFF